VANARKLAPAQRRQTRNIARIGNQQGIDAMWIGFDTPVDDVMRRSPATIRVFLDFGMRCVGCPIACFHTVDDACREHDIGCDRFLDALRAAGGTG
jgi:hybrid cluster-associated redox disulfide protein